ncbi:50S ribosomal protein L21e [Candidatus Woesearchaeota archaeon]|jgi:ribosomal protein L21E|nr:50S ribosomal protein L21e [Candidatus Woesearchaeota archaeon]MBT4114082.1 50S ribosomal protein L21e [Candidatus Woesearchaeota archaeon]MBT4248549.1 50S ribosomal protein L21e [Candidatus Woesearchaeota archaeon]
MVQRTGGSRYKTRHKLQKKARDRGKLPITKILRTFDIGERVRIMQESSQHSAMPHPRFKNLVGTVKKMQGKAYLVQIKDIRKIKHVLAKAVHLRKL